MDDEIETEPVARERPVAGESDLLPDGHDRESPPRRLSRSDKLRRGLVAVAAVALAVMVLAARLPNTGASLRALLGIPTPAPTATPIPGAGTFLIVDTVPWGTLLVDGHAPRIIIPPPDVPDGPGGVPRFDLGAGRYNIEYRATPFPTLRCTMSVPAAAEDTCPLVGTSVASGDPGRPFAAARVLDLEARPERLTGTALASLEQAVASGFDASAQPAALALGDHYPGADGTIRTASEPLQAVPIYTLNQDPDDPLPGDSGPCITLCRSFQSDFTTPEGSWVIAAHVVLSWRITRPDGAVVVADAPAAPVARDAHLLLTISPQWSGSWHVDTSSQSFDLCTVGNAALFEIIAAMTHGQGLPSYSGQLNPEQTAADGCLIVEVKVTPSGTPVPGPLAEVLYRCGALVAVNDRAHVLFPSLPLASSHERALA